MPVCGACEVPNSKRWDMSVSKDQYTGSNMCTLDEMRRCEKKKGPRRTELPQLLNEN